MVLVPEREWQSWEVEEVRAFVDGGGVAFLAGRVPSSLFSVEPVEADTIYLNMTGEYTAPEYFGRVRLSYYEAYYSVRDGRIEVPTLDPRPMLYYPSRPGNATVVAWALDERGREMVGCAILSFRMGGGLLVLCAPTIFDHVGQIACGAPDVNPGDRYGLRTAVNLVDILNHLFAQLLLEAGRPLPLRWSIPEACWNVVFSRDDMDYYQEQITMERALIDWKHGVRCIFFELGDQVESWPFLLGGYHLPGYHRNTPAEETAEAYLNRMMDIENETGRPVLFECHHGGGRSGWRGQIYVETAAAAAEAVGHWVVYTSEPSLGNRQFPMPWLIRGENGSLEPSSYYSYSKTKTIDSMVYGKSVERFCSYLEDCMNKRKPIFYLLHSCNFRTSGLGNYDALLYYVNAMVPRAYRDPEGLIRYNLAASVNVTAACQYGASRAVCLITVNQSIPGYSFLVPYSPTMGPWWIYFDGYPVMDGAEYPLGSLRCILFSRTLAQGQHNLTMVWTRVDFANTTITTGTTTTTPVPVLDVASWSLILALTAPFLIIPLAEWLRFRRRRLRFVPTRPDGSEN